MGSLYEYAALRVVPRVDREESMNGGVLCTAGAAVPRARNRA
ncbi:DUF3037 domain-containing protein [Amycolatopsis regifaucium]